MSHDLRKLLVPKGRSVGKSVSDEEIKMMCDSTMLEERLEKFKERMKDIGHTVLVVEGPKREVELPPEGATPLLVIDSLGINNDVNAAPYTKELSGKQKQEQMMADAWGDIAKLPKGKSKYTRRQGKRKFNGKKS